MNNIKQHDCTELIKNFKEANVQIKLLEQEEVHLSVPSISQLRDVAYHLVKAIETDNNDEIDKQLELARNHAIRAKYDTYEARMTFYLLHIKDFIENFSQSSEVLEVIPEYTTIIAEVEEIKINFENNLNIPHESRHDYYSQLEDDLEKLKKINTKFKVSTQTIYVLINENIDKKNTEIRKDIRNLALGFGTFLLTALGIYLSTS